MFDEKSALSLREYFLLKLPLLRIFLESPALTPTVSLASFSRLRSYLPLELSNSLITKTIGYTKDCLKIISDRIEEILVIEERRSSPRDGVVGIKVGN